MAASKHASKIFQNLINSDIYVDFAMLNTVSYIIKRLGKTSLASAAHFLVVSGEVA